MAEFNLNTLVPSVYVNFFGAFLDNSYSEYVLKGGRGSIKSSIASYLGVLNVLGGKNSVCIRRYATSLRGSCYNDIMVAIERLGVSHEFTTKVSPLEIRHKSGRIIAFRGLDDPQKIKSLKAPTGQFGFLWFEETQEIEGYIKCRSVIQTVARGGQHCNILFSFNPPPSGQHWVNKELGLQNKKSKLVLHTTYLDVPKEWLGEQFYEIAEDLKISNYDAYRNEYLGEACGSKGMVFPNVRAWKGDITFDLQRVYRGNDFGFTSDPNSYVSWYYDRSRHELLLKHSFYAKGVSIETLASEIRKENIHNFSIKCDCAEPRSIADLVSRGIVGAVACKKGADSIRHGIKWLQSLKAIHIDSRLYPEVYNEFSQYEYIMDKNGEYTGELSDKNNHSIDATRYACEDLIAGY